MTAQGRVHNIATKDDVPVPVMPATKPPGGGTPVTNQSVVMPPGVRPANSWEAMLDQLPPQSTLL